MESSVNLVSCLPVGLNGELSNNPLKGYACVSSFVQIIACSVMAFEPTSFGESAFILLRSLLGGLACEDGFIDWVDGLLAAERFSKVKTLKRYGIGSCGCSLAIFLCFHEYAILTSLRDRVALKAAITAGVIGHLTSM